MLDWLSWPADLLLNAGAVVASWFISKDATNFILVQMMVATLVLAASVAALYIGNRWLIFGNRVGDAASEARKVSDSPRQ